MADRNLQPTPASTEGSPERMALLEGLDSEGLLLELLACIHGDGGHHADSVGLSRAVFDAELRLVASPPVAVQEERDASEKLLKDLRWRLDDIRDMLMKEGFNGERIYGCDEWSTPTVNLATAISVIDKALAAMKGDQP